MKTRMYEDVMDERDAPKPAPKPIEQWDHTELRRAMMDDARKMNFETTRRVPKNTKANQYDDHQRRDARTIEAMLYIGRPCSRQEIADLLGVSLMTAYNYVRPLVMADVLTTDRHEDGQTVLYALTEGYDGQKLLEL